VDNDFCSLHDPANADAMAEPRPLGGQRRKREATLADVYDLGRPTNVPDIQLLEMVGHAEQMIERFNDRVEWEAECTQEKTDKAALPKPVDIEALKRAAQPSADELAHTLVDLAGAEACDMMGEHHRA
jgi:hypothetical protein